MFVRAFVLAGALWMAACSPAGLAIGAASGAAVSVAKEKPVGDQLDDLNIDLAIQKAWFDADPNLFIKIDAFVNDGNVLLTGLTNDPTVRVEAARIAWEQDGVKSLVNEVQIAGGGGLAAYARDSWVTAQLLSRITFDTSIRAVNYTVDTVEGVIYLMGIAQNEGERDRVIRHARQIPYVRQISDYTRIKKPPGPVIASSQGLDSQ
ncbi:MAG: BON domain-containing protein [Pseudomonadota bacterium]